MTASKADPILLSLFAARFMSVAEAMGRSLQRTSISTNIKERLDFSCAIFSPDGSLVANAPHLPVHLGSMSFAVRYQIDRLMHGKDGGDKDKDKGIKQGDVILANHPSAGGSHLPDMTCITPVFDEAGKEIIFFTASRGHHADIGGILPGSMPPTSKNIYEEGAQIKSFKIVKEGVYDRKGFLYHLCEEPAKYPGCSGTRCLRDVESDMQAQIAANQKGINLIHGLVEEWGLQTVQDYMRYIRENAELAVRNLLREVAKRQGGTELWARDQMDDGSPIELKVTINEEEGSAVFDFEGTGPEVNANHNCPKSVVHSAIIYCLRAMIDLDIPLNQGCLLPVDIKIPVGCFLDPSDDAAVVAGNVLTSQRITDVVLKAFGAVAASQGCMNNLSFGTDNFGYYETIAGGTGAGPGFHGTDGIQSHMTNTASVDPEILERRYPVLLRQLALREGSGGKGKWKGGEGVVRDLEFQLDMQVSILSERRVFKPFGMQGGEDAQRGSNIWVKKIGDKEERRINMGGKSTAKFHRGDRIIINTPGGGGWGEPVEEDKASSKDSKVAGMFAVDTRKGSLVDRVQTMLGA